MAKFYPIYVRRSDGQLEVVGKAKRKEPNQPTEEQMDQKPDKNGVSDFYRQVQPDEVKNLDWRRKLGGMLARELNWADKGGQECGHILVTFPEGYRLFEHIKKSEKEDGKTEVKNKTHAAGGNDRQDAYLYGHPLGRRKRFRSPADFFPHLLWLCTDESGDPDNCSCKLCCSEELESLIPDARVSKEKSSKSEAPQGLNSAQPSKTGQQAEQRQPVTQPSRSLTPRTGDNAAHSNAHNQAVSTELTPSPLPRPTSHDQQLDREYRGFRYRAGELCWFSKDTAWGLGVILRRWGDAALQYYSIQPLSHPYTQHPQSPTTKSETQDMRPWLAWSVPQFSHPGLNDLPEPARFENVDWNGIIQKKYGSGDLEMDGSILAAKSIDSSYTPLNVIGSRQLSQDTLETRYNALFLGGERIWLGEPVRVETPSNSDVMIVQAIIEQSHIGGSSQPTLQLQGDIFTLTSIQHADPAVPTPASPMNNSHLPQRMNEDLAFRNARSIQLRQVAQYWKLIAVNARLDLNSIKGRWYEASLWLPLLHEQVFQRMYAQGDIDELTKHMNGRGDCLNANRDPRGAKAARINIRRATREDALQQAVPPNTRIIDGVTAPMQENMDPALSSSSQMEVEPPGNNSSVDQYMNLDGMDAYDHNYAQNRQGHY